MSNMSYCRFQNTANDLRDCVDHALDQDLSDEEQAARRALVYLAIDLLGKFNLDGVVVNELRCVEVDARINDAVQG